jgi:hypothetical protein
LPAPSWMLVDITRTGAFPMANVPTGTVPVGRCGHKRILFVSATNLAANN